MHIQITLGGYKSFTVSDIEAVTTPAFMTNIDWARAVFFGIIEGDIPDEIYIPQIMADQNVLCLEHSFVASSGKWEGLVTR